MSRILIFLLTLPWLAIANDNSDCARVLVTSDYGKYSLSLKPGEPEILTLGGGYSLALLADPVGDSGHVRITADTHYNRSRFSTNVTVGPDNPTSVVVAGLSVELSVEPF
ncbi:hypothetical protein [Ferrimonas sp. YFM]|uniref:hypothetical protein n=1 Tax=Ferrimonas sp. YFM TaxID=3028878 RepID=UPI002573A2AC|nr:hypothetical protein [Ferrimonas sp. YFM]BDY04801.1 hypothetical protein F0521_18420 [Ferrimonas sp. YFM]